MIVVIRRFTLFVVGVTLPLQAFSVLEFGLPTTPFKLATAILLVVGAAHFLLGARRPPDTKIKWIALFAVFYGIAAVQGFFRGVPTEPLIGHSVTTISLLLYYVLIGFVVLTREDMVILLGGLVAGGAVTAAPAVLGLERASSIGRYSGLSGQENLFGIDMSVVVVVSVALFVGTRSVIKKGLLAAVAAMAVTGILLSLSRTAFGMGIAMWCLWVYRSRRLDTLKYVFPAVALLVGVLALAPSSVQDRLRTVTDASQREQDQSIGSRFIQAEYAFKAFASNPLLGVGALSFVPWANSQRGGEKVTHVIHNAYLRIAAAQGLSGLIPYLMILYLSWRQYTFAWRTARAWRSLRDPVLADLGAYAMFLQIALFGTMVSGLAAHSQKSKTAWLILALSPIVLKLVKERVTELDGRQPDRNEDPATIGMFPEGPRAQVL